MLSSEPSHASQGHEWRGVVLSAPMLLINPKQATPVKRFLAATLASVLPKMGIDPSLPGTAVSRTEAVQASYDNDPLVFHGRTRINWYMAQCKIESQKRRCLARLPLTPPALICSPLLHKNHQG